MLFMECIGVLVRYATTRAARQTPCDPTQTVRKQPSGEWIPTVYVLEYTNHW